jgi:hypothetical protein
MPAFIDPEATKVVDLPACYCPESPHDHDTVTIRAQFGYGDVLELARVHTSIGHIDPMAERAKLLELGIVSWSFVDKSGEPVPLSLPMILLLHSEIVEPIAEALDLAYQESAPPLPNPSSGRSQPSSRASSAASPNRAQRRAKKPSTSKS